MQKINDRASQLRRQDRRLGLATLETVMSFPPLIALAAMMIAIGSASVRKADTIVLARHATWSHRSERPGTVFPESELRQGMIGDGAQQRVSMPGGLAALTSGESSLTAVSRNHIHVDPWDDPHAGFNDQAPHFSPMFRMASTGLIGQSELQTFFDQFGASDLQDLTFFLTTEINHDGPTESTDEKGNKHTTFIVENRELFNSSNLSGVQATIANQLSGGDPLTEKISGPVANSMLQKSKGFFGQIEKILQEKNHGTLRGVARKMNKIVIDATEMLAATANGIDPTSVIDQILDELPPEIREMAEGSEPDAPETTPPDDKNESDEEKAAKDLVGLIKNARQLLKTIKASPTIVAEPIRNLQEAAHGRDVDSDGNDGADFEEQLDVLNTALNDLRSVMTDLQDALTKIGIP